MKINKNGTFKKADTLVVSKLILHLTKTEEKEGMKKGRKP